MSDCVNGDIRDVLPELVNGTLPAGDAERVQDHVGRCASCAAEVELIRAARAAMRLAPTMDTMRIASAVQASTAQHLAARRVPARASRVASVWLVVVLGAVGLWVIRDSSQQEPAQNVVTAEGANIQEPVESVPGIVESIVVHAPAQLALGGDMSQLEDDQLLTLLEEVSGLEAMPGEEPASLAIEPVVPVDQEE